MKITIIDASIGIRAQEDEIIDRGHAEAEKLAEALGGAATSRSSASSTRSSSRAGSAPGARSRSIRGGRSR